MKQMRVSLVLLLIRALTTWMMAQDHKIGHGWGYDGDEAPVHWGDLKPEFAICGTGHNQSPIDIGKTQRADLPPIEFAYKSSALHIIDSGHTIMINYAPGSSIRVSGKQYELKQFHFHKPSEERINGKAYAMDIHLVQADEEGHLAVVAILLEEGKASPPLDELWKNLPKEKQREETPEGVQINAADFLPTDRGYYTFEGFAYHTAMHRECHLVSDKATGPSLDLRECPVRKCLSPGRTANPAAV
jgi:carbonic anhydrase